MAPRKVRGLVFIVASLSGCVGIGQAPPIQEKDVQQTPLPKKDSAETKPVTIPVFDCNRPLHYTGLAAVQSRKLGEERAPDLGRLSLIFRDSTNVPEYRIRGGRVGERGVGVVRLSDPQGMPLDSTRYRPLEADTAAFTARQGEVQVTVGFLGYVLATADLTIRAGWDDVYLIPMKPAQICQTRSRATSRDPPSHRPGRGRNGGNPPDD